ncbi:tyrosine-type recombinase/integrase [Peribacillus frigoritolerans]|uniref:tyrosine-type recombinase/integrase n=1 Tax=Peribacillus frigoritolerans TaxID=450367 RepID=UPI0023DA1B00|nr:tyrosine-type recombinase/integrase [Peribacillus frigoritolerans]MDF1998155.1 tyrosine-type recombinase/integrase [Peribacillus frigoritolerans]
MKETLGASASRISTKIFHNDEDTRFLEFVKHDYEKELPEKSRKLIYFKRDKERDFAILSLFLGSGIQVNELSNLRLKDLDFEEKQAYVFLTRVNDGATPLSNRAIEALVRKYTKAFKSNKSMSPHKLLMTQLGHTSTTTAALYTNPEQEKAKKAAKQLGERRTNYRGNN